MRRLALLAVLLGLGSAALALNAERVLVFFFDPTQVAPTDPRLSEQVWQGPGDARLVLWLAPPRPGKPTILYFHGNAGNLAARAGRFARILDHGYGLVAMAYPGSSGSTGELSSAAIQRLARALYDTLPDLPGMADADKVVLYGESLGTGVATELAAELAPDASPAGLVLEAPYTSILDVGKRAYPLVARWLHYLGNPWVSRDHITRVTVPTLILHGTADRVIPPDMGQTLFDLSPAPDKQLLLVQGAGHENVWQPAAERTLYAFLDRL
ncbi:MAG TPA: alpha/beta hydrolase [Aliiroseovarius sp.]|nr:alpha/beta hydrolase [Aliiroseovarius sp.]